MCALIETPIIKDMRQTARLLGIVEDLIQLRACCGREACADCVQRLDAALEILGVPTPHPIRLTVPPDPRD